MWKLLKIELFKIFKKPRTYIAFIAIACIVVLIQLALYADGESYIQIGLSALSQAGIEINGKILNGYLVCFVILQLLLIHVPLLIALVAGDLIAGEANMGTLRLLITKPASRTQLLLSKFFASLIYTMALLVFMSLLALGLSLLIFGSGDLLVQKSESVILLQHIKTIALEDGTKLATNDILWRYFAAFGFAAVAMSTVASLAFFLSVFADNSIGPIVATMSIIILFTILLTMDIPLFNAVKPYLFINHMLNWKGFFEDPVDYREIGNSLTILFTHILLFVSATIIIFKKKDILS